MLIMNIYKYSSFYENVSSNILFYITKLKISQGFAAVNNIFNYFLYLPFHLSCSDVQKAHAQLNLELTLIVVLRYMLSVVYTWSYKLGSGIQRQSCSIL